MKIQILIAALAAFACAYADTSTATGTTPRRHSGAKQRAQMKRFGGLLPKPGSAQGKVLVLNGQKRVAAGDLAPALEQIKVRLHPDIEIRESSAPEIDAVAAAVKAAGGQLGIILTDKPGIPSLITAPEEGWALVNVAKLADGNPAADVLAARVRKEILRAFALIGGGAFMALDAIVMRPDVRIPADLDTIKLEQYGIDICRTLERNLPRLGVVPWRITTYANACAEGWAPQPTNEFQKAIWDKARELPTKPIEIKYDPKRDK